MNCFTRNKTKPFSKTFCHVRAPIIPSAITGNATISYVQSLSSLTAGSHLTHAHKPTTHFYIRNSSGESCAQRRRRPNTPRPTRFRGGGAKPAVAAEFYGTGAPAVSVEEATVDNNTTHLPLARGRRRGRRERSAGRIAAARAEPSRTVRE